MRTIAGLSNLTTGKGPADVKRILEAVYLPMLAAAGLDPALVNIFNESLVRAARAIKALQDPKPFTWPVL